MRPAPTPQRGEDRLQRSTMAGHTIPDAEPGGRERLADNQVIRRHLSQLFAQYFGRDAWHRPA